MREINQYACEKCESLFDYEEECIEHKETCGTPNINKCDKCGSEEDVTNDEYGWKSEGWYYIDLGRPGYGSGFDGCDVSFLICDNCLHDFVNSFTLEGQEKIHNSGSNQYLSTEDWLRVHRDEMPDEEMEEKGMYSPRQVKAYNERFPTCKNVKITEYKDGSRGSRCLRFAFGDRNGQCGINVSEECFGCTFYKKRNEGEEIEVVFVYK
jgi:hypothetical protein